MRIRREADRKPRPVRRWGAPPRLACLWLLVLAGSAEAEPDTPLGQITPHLRLLGELRGRSESYDFFKPTLNPDKGIVGDQNAYTFGALRARLGLLLTTSRVDGLVQAEYTGLYGLPAHASGGIPVGPLGLGGVYYQDSGASISPGDVHLKQAYLNFKLQPLLGLLNTYFKTGRFEILDGLEYRSGDTKFDGLKLARVSQRLIGPFDFTHATRNFDGFQLSYDTPALNLTLAAAHPTQGGFNIHAQDEISHIGLAYGALTGKKGAFLPDTEGRLFYLYYTDDRGVQPVDNRPVALRPPLSRDPLALHTLGSHWLTVRKLGPGALDGLIWGAYQFGDWGNLRQHAWAATLELGYQLPDTPLKPWLRAGYFRSSGDTDPGDRSHGTFFQVMPTARLYAKFPFFNLMNLEDAFVQFSVTPTSATNLGVEFHQLALGNRHDLFYGGSGATSRTGSFGYYGRAGGGRGEIGQMLDVSFSQTLGKQFSWSFYYAHVFGGEVIRNVYPAKTTADYAFVEFIALF